MRRLARVVVCALLLGSFGVAAADDAPSPPAQPQTQAVLGGRVTDVTGKPVANARVYVMPRGGGRLQTETDKDGRYTMALSVGGAYSVVIAVDQIHTYRQVLVNASAPTTLDVEVETIPGGEVITIIDRPLPQPEVMPKPQNENVRKSLPYSAQAMERDAWARAFILLDIDERGTVQRIKLLKRPGFDLDQIAIDEAFKLTFDPALDKQGKPMRTYIVWNMEWPSWGWLVQGGGTASGRPVDYDGMYRLNRQTSGVGRNGPAGAGVGPNGSGGEGPGNLAARGSALANANWAQPLPMAPTPTLSRVPCAGSGPLNLDLRNRAYRDCSTPDMSTVAALPWITRANAKTALAELDSNKPQLVARPRGSRVPELIAGSVTAVFGVGLVVSFVQYDRYSDKVGVGFTSSHAGMQDGNYAGKMDKWRTAMFASAGAFVVSGAVTAFLWSRGQTKEYFSVQPTNGGGALSFGRSF
ncbi:MAG: carboxypeptidase regulatory-like domain-containing protein [Deltaproteobacteria bacterium]|nr:carboxypeptidase regulatory-like domain-containing protein [Deltaproteobacteria bacterium]MCW5800958.1 carboxypeptidase regulatory-like domain-containing protein [Deltaproteobacteria bacterium]